MVKMVLEDTLKVILDKKAKKTDTGLFKLIYKGIKRDFQYYSYW